MLSEFQSHCLAAGFLADVPAFALADGTLRRIGAKDHLVQVHAQPSLAAARVPGEEAFLTSGEDGRVCRIGIDAAPRELGCVPRKWVTSVAQRGAHVAYASGRTVWLRSPAGERQIQHPRAVKGVAIAPDERLIAVAKQDGITLHATDDASGEPLELAWNDIHHASTFSPDGRFLMVASQHEFLHGWRLADRRHFRMLGYQAKVEDWSWSADGAFLATSGASAAIVWPFDGDEGPMTRSAIEVAPRAEHTVTAVAWAPDAHTLAIGYSDGAVHVASLQGAPGQQLRTGGRAPVTSVAWDAAGARVAFGSAAGECGAIKVAS